jgi:hypothetical protein
MKSSRLPPPRGGEALQTRCLVSGNGVFSRAVREVGLLPPLDRTIARPIDCMDGLDRRLGASMRRVDSAITVKEREKEEGETEVCRGRVEKSAKRWRAIM